MRARRRWGAHRRHARRGLRLRSIAGVTTLAFALSAFACDRLEHTIISLFLAAGAWLFGALAALIWFWRQRRGARCRRHRNSAAFVVTLVTAQSAREVNILPMGGYSLIQKHLCPACAGPMGLTRTIAASPGYSELRTYGCRECGVWVTEGSTRRDQLERTFGVPKRRFPPD
jgi:hypothetical protein